MIRGEVIRGSWNIFTVKPFDAAGETELECRIKGKVLKNMEGYYNPLAPGDIVTLEWDPDNPGSGRILGAEERRNCLTRFNQKERKPQVLAANLDCVLCLTTPASPPFRPRFLDRLLAQTEIAGIPAVILCNKIDLAHNDYDMDERLEDFRRIGYPLLEVSTVDGRGLDALREHCSGKLSALAGQSGVGKSSLINALIPDLDLRIGRVNEKFDRGNHTTTVSSIFEAGDLRLIDTPGIRRLVPEGITSDELIYYMREFAPLAGKCSFGHSCSHKSEPGCKILEAVAAGAIHEDRYESFIRIQYDLNT